MYDDKSLEYNDILWGKIIKKTQKLNKKTADTTAERDTGRQILSARLFNDVYISSSTVPASFDLKTYHIIENTRMQLHISIMD